MSIGKVDFAHVVQQPEFPRDDIVPDNAEILRIILKNEPGPEGQARILQEHQKALFYIATHALRASDVRVELSQPASYAFSLGYSLMELMIMYIRGRGIHVPTSAKQAMKLLPSRPFQEEKYLSGQPSMRSTNQDDQLTEAFFNNPDALHELSDEIRGHLEEAESRKRELALAARYLEWPDLKPNTYDLVQGFAWRRFDRVPEINASILGSHIAAELQIRPTE